jgi:hypothetical protein
MTSINACSSGSSLASSDARDVATPRFQPPQMHDEGELRHAMAEIESTRGCASRYRMDVKCRQAVVAELSPSMAAFSTRQTGDV